MISRYPDGVTGERQAHILGGARRSELWSGIRALDQEIDENLTNASLLTVVRGAVSHAGHRIDDRHSPIDSVQLDVCQGFIYDATKLLHC
jgi:hypothetical protein